MSSKRCHNYVLVFVDMKNYNVLYATEGKNKKIIESFVNEPVKHNKK